MSVGTYVLVRNRFYTLVDDETPLTIGEQWGQLALPRDMPDPPEGTLWQPVEAYMEDSAITDQSITLSFDVGNDAWVCEHDYFPNAYVAWEDTLINFWSNKLYKHGAKEKNGEYHRNVVFPSFVDLVFSDPPGVTKRLVSLEWHTEVIDYFNAEFSDTLKTFDSVMVYNRQQCSGIVVLTTGNTKRVENKWRMSQFRDIILDRGEAFLDKNGNLIAANINPSPDWFSKRYFIDEYFVVRFIFANTVKKILYLYSVVPNLLRSDL